MNWVEHDEQDGGDGKLVQDEFRQMGSVSTIVYTSYLSSNGGTFVLVIVFFLVLSKLLYTSRDLWLSAWTQVSNNTLDSDQTYYLTIYAYISFATIIAVFISDIVSRFASLR